MRYCVCADAVFQGMPLEEAMGRIKGCGYSAYEFWTWWDRDLNSIRARQEELGLQLTAICAKFLKNPGIPAEQEAYLHDLEESLEAAKYLNCPKLIIQAGWEQSDVSHELHRATFLETMRRAAPMAEAAGILLVIEPLNIRVDHAGYHLWDADEAFEVLKQIGSPSVMLLFDLYHQQITNGHLLARIEANMDQIGHMHAAGCPGRHELTIGELAYDRIFAALEQMGCQCDLGLEYFPEQDAELGLKEVHSWISK